MKIPSLVRKLDIFSINPYIFYRGKEEFNTKFSIVFSFIFYLYLTFTIYSEIDRRFHDFKFTISQW